MPDRSHLPLPPYVAAFAEDVLTLAARLGAAQEIQFQSAPRTFVDTDGRRALGGHSDPTFATVADERRLAVRDAVRKAEDRLRFARATIAAAEGDLAIAVDAWSGVTTYRTAA